MPFNPATAVFARVWRFVDRFLPGDDIAREDLDLALDDIASGVQAALNNNLNFVGDWIAGSAFPNQRPDGSAVRARDTWRVSVGGTVGGVLFEVDDYLTALVPSPGSLYANNWIKIPSLLIPTVLTLVEETEAIRDEVANLFNDFDDRYLGAKAANPTTDNDGNSLLDGALYWNTTLKRFRVYDFGTAQWIDTFLPAGAYLQTALNLADLDDSDAALTNLGLTASAAELNVLDGVTASTAELNILDGVTASTAELNILDGVTASTAELNILDGVTLTAAQINQGVVPPGAVVMFARNSAPTGWLKANGALVSRTTYADLFSAIGTTFGAGDGSTTFALPDLRGEFIRGWDDGRGVDSGRVFGSAQSDLLRQHQHTGGADSFVADISNSGSPNRFSSQAASTGNVASSLGGAETRPRNVALLACIKF